MLAGGAAMLASETLLPAIASADPAPQQNAGPAFDLLIEGGTVVDPGQNLHGVMDVAIKNGKIAEVSINISKDRAAKVIPAKGQIVTPGFIDLHAHCFDGIGIGMVADHFCLARGVTTMVDAGSAGYATIENFRKYIINSSQTRIVALVNMAATGTAVVPGALMNLDWVNPQLTAKAAMNNKPVTVGIKVQLSKVITGTADMECLSRAVKAAEIAQLPLMVHADESYSPLPGILKMMRKGDVYTHCFNNHVHGILDSDGKILPEAHDARDRGILFDPAQGQGHLSFDVAEKCLQQNFLPDTISTDLTTVTAERRVLDLPNMVSKFMAIGLTLDQAVKTVTATPAAIFNYNAEIGTLKPGSDADISIFELRQGNFEFEDSVGGTRTGHQKLFSTAVVRAGQWIPNAA